MNKRIGLIGQNSIEYIDIILNLWNENISVVLIDYQVPEFEVQEIFLESKIMECYIEKSLESKFSNLKKFVNIIFFDGTSKNIFLNEYIYKKFRLRYDENEALVLFSSGTTGKKKGIILSHNAINNNADNINSYMLLNENSKLYLCRNLSHSSTIVGELLVCLHTGAKLFIGNPMSTPLHLINYINEFNIDILCINSSALKLIGNYLLKNNIDCTLKEIYLSGSILYKADRDFFENIFKQQQIYNVYGLTECGPRISSQKIGFVDKYSCGKLLPNTEVKIKNNEGFDINTGEIGLIYVKNNSMFKGYLVGNPKDIVIEDYFCTNDLGYIKENELFVVGRNDDMIIKNGHNIYPDKIADVIKDFDMVEDCYVFGYRKDTSHILIAVYTSSISLDKKLLISHCKNRLISYEIPSYFYQVLTIPKNFRGKILKNDILLEIERKIKI